MQNDLDVRTYRSAVSDGYEHHPERDDVAAVMLDLEQHLIDNPHLRSQPGHAGYDLIYSSPALTAWQKQIPSALALYPLQRPEIATLTDGTAIDDKMRTFLLHSHESVGIRTRAAIMREKAGRLAGGGHQRWLSLACGAAVPVLDAVASLSQAQIDLTVVDRDHAALDFACHLAHAGSDLIPNLASFTPLNADLVRGLSGTKPLVETLGAKSYDFVEMMGIFEYFSDKLAVKTMKASLELVKDGGVLIFGNMLTTSPTLNVNQRGIGWPGVRPRTTEHLIDLVRQAGVSRGLVEVDVTPEGIYAVVTIHVARSDH